MSVVFSLSIPLAELPAPSAFVESIAHKWLETYTDNPNVVRLATLGNTVLPICPTFDELGSDKWVEDRSYLFYLSNISTRGLEVWYVDNSFKVRVMSIACVEEWELAFQILELAADGESAMITTDWQPPAIRLRVIREAFNEKQILDALSRQLRACFDAVSEHKECVVLEGPINKFHLGPWLCNRIVTELGATDEAEILDFVFSLMRFVNYFAVMPQFDGIAAPEIEALPRNSGEETGVAAYIQSEQSYFVPHVDALVLVDNNGGTVTIRSEHFKTCLLKYFREVDELVWLDEYQFVVHAIASSKFEKIMRAIALDFREDGTPRKGNILDLFKR